MPAAQAAEDNQEQAMGALEAKMARFVTEFPSEDIPPAIIGEAKRCIVNYCGVALHACNDPSSEIFVELFAEEGSRPTATILGKRLRTSARNAALANGYLGYVPDAQGFDQGGYETWAARSQAVERGAGEALVATANSLTKELFGS